MWNFLISISLLLAVSVSNADSACERQKLELFDEDFKVDVSLYQPKKSILGTVLIMPPTGGVNVIDKSYAWNLCDAGFQSYILEHWTGDDEFTMELEIHHRLYQRAQKAIEVVMKKSDPGFVGILGTSVGALHAAVAAASDKKLDAVFSIVGGAPIPNIIVNSDQKAMRDAKKERYKIYGFKSDDEYLEALNKVFPLDPFKQPKKYSGMRLGMVIANDDVTVPIQFQKDLQTLWQPQEAYQNSSGHQWTIIRTWLWHRGLIVDFFKNAYLAKNKNQTKR